MREEDFDLLAWALLRLINEGPYRKDRGLCGNLGALVRDTGAHAAQRPRKRPSPESPSPRPRPGE